METQRCPAGSFATVMHNKVFVEKTYFPMEVVAQTLHKYELVNLVFFNTTKMVSTKCSRFQIRRHSTRRCF